MLNDVNLRLPTVHRLIYSLIGAAFVLRGVGHCYICENPRGSRGILMIDKRARKSVASSPRSREDDISAPRRQNAVTLATSCRCLCASGGCLGSKAPLPARSRVNGVIWSNPVGFDATVSINPSFPPIFQMITGGKKRATSTPSAKLPTKTDKTISKFALQWQ